MSITIETPNSRNTDPETSHLAGQEITASGKRQSQIIKVAQIVELAPGLTSRELSRVSPMDRYTIARRLTDAETAGKVKRGNVRQCQIANRKALTWWPVK